jgi:hypothetical protein
MTKQTCIFMLGLMYSYFYARINVLNFPLTKKSKKIYSDMDRRVQLVTHKYL